MDIERIIRDIDAEIARLQSARNALTGISSRDGAARRSTNAVATRQMRKPKRRVWSAAARKRQAEMMKARWVARKKQRG